MVTDAIDRKDWDALRRLAKPGTRAIQSVRMWENSERVGHSLHVAKLLRVENHSKYYLDGEPCIIYSFELQSEDGRPGVHQLQVAVRDEAGKSTQLWIFGTSDGESE